MKPVHLVTLSISCLAVGVIITLLVQSKLNALHLTQDANKTQATVLNPSSFSGGSVALEAQPATAETVGVSEPVPVEPPVVSPTAPPGSGERWTPL